MSKRSAFDTKAVQHVSAFAVLYRGKPAGRIVVGFPIGGSGMGAAIATVAIDSGPLANLGGGYALHGSAGGCGYDKESAAVANAIGRGVEKGGPYIEPYVRGDEPRKRLTKAETARLIRRLTCAGGTGMSVIEALMERLGYTLLRAC